MHSVSEQRLYDHPDLARRAFETIFDLKRSATIDELVSLSSEVFGDIGLPYFALARFFGADCRPRTKVLVGQFHTEWASRYVEKGYAGASSIAREMLRSADPYSWSEVLKSRRASRDQSRIYEEAADFGLKDGLFTPCRLADGSFAAVVLGGPGLPLEDPLARTMAEVLSAYLAAEARRILPSVGTERPTLSPRQRECLSWVREGKSSVLISEIMQISAYMVDEHVSAACAKLGVRTRTQAAVQATLLGLLN